MAVGANFRLSFAGRQTPSTDYTGTAQANIEILELIADGTGANQADGLFHDVRPLGDGATETLSFGGALDAFGVAITSAEVVMLIIEATSTNTTNIELRPSVANGFVAFLQAGSVAVVRPGATLVLFAPPAAAYAAAAGGDDIDITNTAGAAATYTITFLTRSA